MKVKESSDEKASGKESTLLVESWLTHIKELLGPMIFAFLVAVIGFVILLLGFFGFIVSVFLSFAEIVFWDQAGLLCWGIMAVGILMIFVSFFVMFVLYVYKATKKIVKFHRFSNYKEKKEP